MRNLELSTELPDPEAGFDQPTEDPRSSAIPSSLHLYRLEMYEHLARYTGDPNVFLTAAREQELATVVQAGQSAQKVRDAEPAKYLASQQEYDAAIHAGTTAEITLVETNLRFAASMARDSMNYPQHSKKGDEEDLEPPDATAGKISRNKYAHTFADIKEFRSRYAELDTRVQVANIGLMKAARDFRPAAGENGKPVRFTTYAAWKIQGELARHIKIKETPGLYVPVHIAEAITKGRNDPAEMTDELRGWDAGRYTVPLYELKIPASDVEDEDEPTEVLNLADLAQDTNEDVEGEALAFDATDVIRLALEALATIKDIAREKPEHREKRQRRAEREAAVIAMRFGISDNPDEYGQKPTLAEVAEIIGMTRESIRQIESKALAKLRIILGNMSVKGLLDVSAHSIAGSYLPSKGEFSGNVRTGRAAAYGGRDVQGPAVRLKIPDLDKYRGSEVRPRRSRMAVPWTAAGLQQSFSQSLSDRFDRPKESWQAYVGEPFDLQDAAGGDSAEHNLGSEVIAREFKDYLFHTVPDQFLDYLTKGLPTDYPILLVAAANQRFGRQLTAEHIETFWNSHIETFISALGEANDDHSLGVVSSYFARLLAERMTDDSMIELRIPESLRGRLNYIGAFVTNGRVDIHGDVGGFAGYKVGGLGKVVIHGSAGDFAGVCSGGYSELEVKGNAGHFFGGQARESASMMALGSVGDYCGEGIDGSEVGIFVGGDAGNEIASDALRGEITVQGRAGSLAASRNPKVTILLPGEDNRRLRHSTEHRAS